MSGGRLAAGRAGGGPPPWRWVLFDAADPNDRTAVRAHGVQFTRLYASATEVAEERMADAAYRALSAGDVGGLASLVCRVKRVGAAGWEATARGEVWCRRAALARR